MNSIARNDPCPCGSGLKYKKCCLLEKKDTPDQSEETTAQLARAYKLMADRQWDQAASIFRSLLSLPANQCTVLAALAACYDGQEDYLRAAEFYEKAIAVCPESQHGDLYYLLGVSRACAQRIQKAREAFADCMELAANAEKKAQLQRILDHLDLMEAGEKNPASLLVQVQLQRAFSDMETERYEEAAARLGKLSGLDPENSAIFYNLGVVCTFLKEEDRAMEHFRRTVELEPKFVQAWYNMGQICLIKKKDFSLALNYFDRAAAIRPEYVGAHHQRGVAYELLGDAQAAVRCWERTLELDPENKQAKDNIERIRGKIEK